MKVTTLLDAIKFVGDGFDIGDDIFDWGNYFECYSDIKDCKDAYDKVQYVLAKNIEFVKYQKDWYSTCKITQFIEKYIDMFNDFLNEVWREEYQPRYFEKQYTSDDEEFYDIYLESMFSGLINGNYSESDYELLLKLMYKYKLI